MLDYLTDYLGGTAQNWPSAAASLLLALAAGVVLWFVHNALTRFDDHEVLFSSSAVPAYLAQRSSLVLAFGVAALPTVARTGDYGWSVLIGQAMNLAWVVVALLAVRYLVDVVVLPKVDNTAEMLDGNTAAGIVEAGFYIGFGFVLNGSLTGASPSLGTGLASTVVFGALGLALMVSVWRFHEAVTPWDVRAGVRERRLAPAFEAAGVLAGVGIVVREGVAGDFAGWGAGLVAFFVTALFAVATLYAFRFVANRLILRGFTLRRIADENLVGAAAFSAVLMVAVAFVVAAVVRYQL